MDKIFLIDGHSQIFRMFYAFMRHPLINSKGIDTSIEFGFTKMLLEIINREHPTHIAVAFDSHAKTFRHNVYGEYKANRPPAPEQVIESLPHIQEILNALSIKHISIEGFEADDIIGSMAKQWQSPDCEIYMVTPDKDYGQLIDKNIYQYKLPKGKETSIEVVGVDQICANYGISSPKNVIDILAIWGDSSDNVPGVKGVGEVGAKKLIGKYGSIESVFSHIEELSPKLQENLRESEQWLHTSKYLVTIKTDIELPITKDSIVYNLPSKEAVDTLFSKFEFNSLKKMILQYSNEKNDINDIRIDEFVPDFPEDTIEIPQVQKSDIEEFISIVESEKEFALLHLDDASFVISTTGKYIVLDSKLSSNEIARVATIIEDPNISKVGYNLKEIIKELYKSYKLSLKGKIYDVGIMHYVVNPEVSHNLDFIIKEAFHIDIESINQENSSNQYVQLDIFSTSEEFRDCDVLQKKIAIKASLSLRLKESLINRLTDEPQVYPNIEMPLISVLSQMELTGVRIDKEQLNTYSKGLGEELKSIEADIQKMANSPALNISSPKQIGELLYDQLKIAPEVKRSIKGNYPTDEQTLRSFKDRHPIIEKILEFRNLKKLLSTYIEPLPELIDPHSGKIHTTFNQALTSTGRLSSANPNLQNIPIRTERGREIRKAFIPSDPDGYIVSADYSQIELRLMAHLSNDKELINAFISGEDIHSSTAAKLFGLMPNTVTKEQRRIAKTVNFGIIYGISSFGLAERLEMGVREAKEFIDSYFKTYPSVKEYIANTIEFAKSNGYVKTLYGRRRYFSDINSRNPIVRKSNERNAINAPLQGSAADIIKIAMVNIAHRFEKEKIKSKMILQVHDELVFDVVKEELNLVQQIAQEEMNNVIKLSVPLIAECGYGKNWLEAH